MQNTIFVDPYMELVVSDNTLILRWKQATADMTSQQFQLALALYATEACAHRVTGLLVDTREFRFSNPGAVETWRDKTIIPIYNHAGVRKFGFILPQQADLPPQSQAGGIKQFATRFFHSTDDAHTWLRS